MTYAEKLKDPRWQRKRLEMFQQANFTCQLCGDAKRTLHVHHKIYHRGRVPWEYQPTELEVLCEDCHEKREDALKALRMTFSGLSPEQMTQIVFLLGEIGSILGRDGLIEILKSKAIEAGVSNVEGSLKSIAEGQTLEF